MHPMLGFEYRDQITGFQGICVGFAQYISGCHQALLVPPVDANGAYRDGQWFDAQRLVKIDGGRRVDLDNGLTPGCDQPAPKR